MAIHGVLVTYRRPEWLERSLEEVARQTLPPHTLTVVDNDPGPRTRAIVANFRDRFASVTYLASPSNRGPAGGLADGVAHVLADAADEDWVLFLDDDDPPRRVDAVERLVAFGEQLRASGPVGGVGVSGSRLDRSSGRLVRPRDDELAGVVAIDYVGGNQLPLYAVDALRAAGGPMAELFFGFDDLELGLRLGRAGYPLFSDGDLHRWARGAADRLGLEVLPASGYTSPPGWRRYYSLRNQVWILRDHGLGRQAAQVALTQGLAKPARNALRQPRLAYEHARTNARAVRDGFRSRLGLTVPPG